MSRYKNNQLETLSTANANRTAKVYTAYIDEYSGLETWNMAQENKNHEKKKIETKINRNAFRNWDVALGAVAQINVKWQDGREQKKTIWEKRKFKTCSVSN